MISNEILNLIFVVVVNFDCIREIIPLEPIHRLQAGLQSRRYYKRLHEGNLAMGLSDSERWHHLCVYGFRRLGISGKYEIIF